jgi:hypothetical protein
MRLGATLYISVSIPFWSAYLCADVQYTRPKQNHTAAHFVPFHVGICIIQKAQVCFYLTNLKWIFYNKTSWMRVNVLLCYRILFLIFHSNSVLVLKYWCTLTFFVHQSHCDTAWMGHSIVTCIYPSVKHRMKHHNSKYCDTFPYRCGIKFGWWHLIPWYRIFF